MTAPTWMSRQAYERLQQKLSGLRRLMGSAADADEVSMQIQRIHDLMLDAIVGDDPPDDGIAEPGMVVTVRFEDSGDIETFLLGVRGAEHGDVEVYSTRSPLGAALVGASPGEQRTYRLPSGTTLTVTLLAAVPYGVHVADLSA
ncbi:GreA/GreB family elongation factor [Mycobacterium vicinigordonae]|uniref:GreA/GreB family elongation factor n=1 Tax=Mycobacterium vicinigordonae TaxID=1719132 RepID=A0A7D6I0I1_9MYCO|nr:GreA/GreB family elongation factor [Mycobacterium vicinigordonae]QLL09495.1 GreA/GreB family elongation factor [Mycobacterium vicinigordonae]